MATQLQIAEALGIDVSSVNKILNHKKGPVFKPDTIKKVFRMAKYLKYRMPARGKGALHRILVEIFPVGMSDEDLAVLRNLPLERVTEIRNIIGRE